MGVLVVSLVAAGAFAAVGVLRAGGQPVLPGILPGQPTELRVVGQAPSGAGTWSSGTKQVWRTSGEHDAGGELRSAGYFNGTMAATSRAWALTDLVGDITHGVWAFDAANGEPLWNDWGEGGADFIVSCGEALPSGLVPCIAESGQGEVADVAYLELIDWKTGRASTKVKLKDLGIEVASTYNSYVQVIDGSLVLTFANVVNNGPDFGPIGTVIVARVSADAKKAHWVTKNPGCNYDDWVGPNFGVTADLSLHHGIVFTSFGQGFDFATGKPVVGELHCVAPVADGVLIVQGRQGDPSPTSVTAPDGTILQVTDRPSGLVLRGKALPLPLRLDNVTVSEVTETDGTTRKEGTADLTAFDPHTQAAAWKDPITLPVTQYGDDPLAGSAYFDGTRLYVSNEARLTAVNAQTGEVLWTRSFRPRNFPQTSVAADGTLLTGDYQETTAFDPGNGDVLWSLPGSVELMPGPDGESIVYSPQSTNSYLARLDPADRAPADAEPPAGAPTCPTGMTAVSWTQYADGAILLCQGDQRYVVVVPDHPDWHATDLTFTDGGHEVAFSNGTKVRVSLGGSLVYVETGGAVAASPVTKSWSPASGTASIPLPNTLRTCPAGSWPISVSTFDGGWLLVCGMASDQPSVIYLSDGATVTEAGSVTVGGGGYCGTAGSTKVCAYSSPALVTVDSGGGVTQHNVSGNYFDGRGGGVGEGNGSYGVQAPDQNARDQVRYLTQILQKSMAGRSSLDLAVNQVRSCTDVAGATITFNDVATNRQQLLDALESAPVDAIPDGQSLVAQLRTALQLSHESDLVWIQWGQAQQANACADGESNPAYVQVVELNKRVAQAKDEFLGVWNSSIAGTYGAPTFTKSQI